MQRQSKPLLRRARVSKRSKPPRTEWPIEPSGLSIATIRQLAALISALRMLRHLTMAQASVVGLSLDLYASARLCAWRVRCGARSWMTPTRFARSIWAHGYASRAAAYPETRMSALDHPRLNKSASSSRELAGPARL